MMPLGSRGVDHWTKAEVFVTAVTLKLSGAVDSETKRVKDKQNRMIDMLMNM